MAGTPGEQMGRGGGGHSCDGRYGASYRVHAIGCIG